MSANQPTLLVTGASGHLGRRVLELLIESGQKNIIAATRTPEKLDNFKAQGVEVRYADFENSASLAEAFVGVDRLLLVSTDALGENNKRLKQHLAAVKAAEDAGVKHVVYTSLINPGPQSPIFIASDHFGTESALLGSEMGWTILRNNIYADQQIGNITFAVKAGQLYSAGADGKTGYITREDCARAAAAALAAPFWGRRILDVTGPEALSGADLAAIITQVTGQKVSYVPISVDALVQNMESAGLPRFLAEGFATFDVAMANGALNVVTDAVEELTGRKPISFAEFLESQRDTILQDAAVNTY
jgi:NAD(P)H dehydrogenase (quinone)